MTLQEQYNAWQRAESVNSIPGSILPYKITTNNDGTTPFTWWQDIGSHSEAEEYFRALERRQQEQERRQREAALEAAEMLMKRLNADVEKKKPVVVEEKKEEVKRLIPVIL